MHDFIKNHKAIIGGLVGLLVVAGVIIGVQASEIKETQKQAKQMKQQMAEVNGALSALSLQGGKDLQLKTLKDSLDDITSNKDSQSADQLQRKTQQSDAVRRSRDVQTPQENRTFDESNIQQRSGSSDIGGRMSSDANSSGDSSDDAGTANQGQQGDNIGEMMQLYCDGEPEDAWIDSDADVLDEMWACIMHDLISTSISEEVNGDKILYKPILPVDNTSDDVTGTANQGQQGDNIGEMVQLKCWGSYVDAYIDADAPDWAVVSACISHEFGVIQDDTDVTPVYTERSIETERQLDEFKKQIEKKRRSIR